MRARTHTLVSGSAARIALAAAGIAPFLLDPFGFDRWVFAKELAIVCAALVAVWMSPLGRTTAWWRWWLLSAGAVLIIGATSSAAPLAQLFGRWPRYEGLVSLGLYALAVALGARLLGGGSADARTRRNGDLFHATLSAGLCAAALIAAAQAFGVNPISTDLSRSSSLLGNASDLGIVGVVGLALFLPRAARREPLLRHRTWSWLGLGSSLLLVALSGSRGAMVGAAVALIATAACAIVTQERERSWWLTVATTVTGVAALSALTLTSRVATSGQTAQASAANRPRLWGASSDLLASHVLSGVGASGFEDAITVFLDDSWFADTGTGRWIESPHNVLLQVGVAGGILGLGALSALIILAIWHVRRHGLRGPYGPAGVIALSAAGTALLFHFTSPGTVPLLCIIAGATVCRPPSQGIDLPYRRVLASIGIGVWALALILAIAADHRLGAGFQQLDKDVAAAESSFSVAEALRPWDVDIPLMIAERSAARIELEGNSAAVPFAATWADSAVERLPASTRALKAHSVIAQYSGDFPTGIEALTRAAMLSPTDPQVFHRLGALQFLAGDAVSATATLERALALAPNDEDIRSTLDYVRPLAAG